MKKDEIHARLNDCNENILKGDGIKNFPQIIQDLYFIMAQLKQEEKSLPTVDRFTEGAKYFEKKSKYYIELLKLFLKNEYGMSLNVINDPEVALLGCAGYDAENDRISVSTLGFLLGGNSETSPLQTLFHESRHKIQNDAFHASEEEFLRYPENMIILLKESILEDSHKENDRQFYKDNYDILYYEVDADQFGLWGTRNFLEKMLKQYKKYAEENNIEVPRDLEVMVLQLQKLILKESAKDNAFLQEQGRARSSVQREAEGRKPASTSYQIEGNETDRLILNDQYIKSHPELQEIYPPLRFIMDHDKPKSYEQIVREREALIEKYKDQTVSNAIPKEISYEERIRKMYDCMIKSDPILYIEDLIAYQKDSELKTFLAKHPSLSEYYKEELQAIYKKTGNEDIKECLKQTKK